MNNKHLIIVGAGIGGLASALRMAKRGFSVEIIEKNSKAGGRLNQIKKDGFTFDTGPSFFSMSYIFEEFAKDCNIKLPFKYIALDPLYSVNFKNNPKTYYLYKDIGKLASQFEEAEPGFEAKMNKYLQKSGRLFHDTLGPVIKKNFDSLPDYLYSLMQVKAVHLPVLLRSFWKQVALNFSSKEARQIISLVSFFLGQTPFDTMAVYTLLSYTEFMHDGYYNVEGGMYKIAEGLLEELKKENVKISYNTEIVDAVAKGNQLKYLVDQQGRKWESDVFLINADAAVFRGRIFKRKQYSESRLDKMKWTTGYLTMYIGVKCKLPHVNYHSYFLGNNYEEYANNILNNPEILEQPYYYVNVVSKHNVQCAPEGCESLFFVCPVPNLLYKHNWNDRDKIADNIIDDFSKRIDFNIKPVIVSKTIYTPVDWQNQFNLHRGSGLGLGHNMRQIGYFRPANFDEEYKNVFYAGASTIPGTGLPMVIISSDLACQRIVKYFS
jgi:phytoene desaturase